MSSLTNKSLQENSNQSFICANHVCGYADAHFTQKQLEILDSLFPQAVPILVLTTLNVVWLCQES